MERENLLVNVFFSMLTVELENLIVCVVFLGHVVKPKSPYNDILIFQNLDGPERKTAVTYQLGMETVAFSSQFFFPSKDSFDYQKGFSEKCADLSDP